MKRKRENEDTQNIYPPKRQKGDGTLLPPHLGWTNNYKKSKSKKFLPGVRVVVLWVKDLALLCVGCSCSSYSICGPGIAIACRYSQGKKKKKKVSSRFAYVPDKS